MTGLYRGKRLLVHSGGCMTLLSALFVVGTLGLAQSAPEAVLAVSAASPALPDDARLAPVRARLEEIVRRAAAAGPGAELLVSKVREGLAKRVDAARIEATVVRLAQALGEARAVVGARRPGAPAPLLVRAVAEARLAGLDIESAETLLRSGRAEAPTARAVEVLADLSGRGYRSLRAAPLVRDVLVRDPAAIERLSATLETLRVEQALTHAEAVDALARGLSASPTLQSGYTRTMDDERRGGNGRGRSKNDNDGAGGAPGKSGLAPGRLPKMKAGVGKGRE